jgi:hypothetical protein
VATLDIPDDALLTRDATAAALTEAGFPTSPATLATKATRGGGPPFRRFGPRPLYTWGDALRWAETRLGPLIFSTSEASASNHPANAERDVTAPAEPASPHSAKLHGRPLPGGGAGHHQAHDGVDRRERKRRQRGRPRKASVRGARP